MRKEIVDIGIYPKHYEVPENIDDMKHVFRKLANLVNNPPPQLSARQQLADLDLRLCRIITPYIEPGSEGIEPGWWGIIEENAPAQVHDAVDVLRRLRETWDDLANCTPEEIFLFGIGIGQRVERCSVMRFEPLVLKAKKTQAERIDGARKGAASRRNRSAGKAQKIREFVNKKAATGVKIGAAKKLAEKKFRCSSSTIERACREST